MTKTNTFDYSKYELAVDIYNYAERLVIYPNDRDNIDMLRNTANLALETCRKTNVNWIARCEPCKGKKLAGRWKVVVETWQDTSYGWSHYKENADKIYNNLRTMWLSHIHGDQISDVTGSIYHA